ncbi:hypothetical protein M3Y99_00678800 [Aphelenchoides fujianensis]|nr:hypothetical protein M3Y99_00678800 [Aphelenchoides fujianensis]
MHAPTLSEILVVLLVLLLFHYLKSIFRVLHDVQRQLRFTRGIDGPPSLPLIGSAHLFMTRSSHETLQFLLAEAKKVTDAGGHIMKVWLGPMCALWLLDNESAKVVLGSTTEITKGPAYSFFTRWLGSGLLIGNGDVWRKMRKIVTPAFHFGKIEEYSATMEHHVRMRRSTYTAMAYDMKSQAENDNPYSKAVEFYSHLGWIQFQRPHYMLFGGLLWKLLGYEAQTVKTLKTLKAVSREIVNKRMRELGDDVRTAEGEEKRRKNFLDILLEHQHENRLTSEELGAEVDTFVFAGHDTVSHAVSWSVWCLATHPDAQERLYAELVEHFGHSDAEFATKKIHELPFLDACFKEAMRVFPPVPFVQIFPNPTHFDPERFLGDREFPANSYVPFSAGSRNCIGQKFAQREALIIISHLVYNFELTSDYRFAENLPIPETITKPSLGVPVRLRPRHAFLVKEAHKALAAGESVMRLWIGPKLLIVPVGPESIKVSSKQLLTIYLFCLLKAITMSTTELEKGEDYKWWEPWLGRALLLGSGPRHHKMRKLLTPAFHFARIERYVDSMDEHIRVMIDLLHKRPAGEEIDLYEPLKLCSLDIIADTIMGVQLNCQNKPHPYVHAVERFNMLGFVRQFAPQYFLFGDFLWKLLGYEAEANRELKVLKAFTHKIVTERMEAFDDQKLNGAEKVDKSRLNFLDLLLELQSEGEIPTQWLIDECETAMFAGHDTTSHAVTWAIWALATNPHCQERLHAEIVEHFGQSDNELHTQRIKDLPYLDACLKEAMRLFAPIPLIQRKVNKDMEMGGHLIPGNCSVSISPYLLGHNPEIFENHEKYEPERFMNGHDYPFAFIPFSAGIRNCIGQKFALREAKMLIAHLIYNFEISSKYRMEENTPASQIVLRPVLGVPVYLKPRNQ